MSALWMIGLFILFVIAAGFALLLCKAAALSDRDVEYPIQAGNVPSFWLVEGSDDSEICGMPTAE